LICLSFDTDYLDDERMHEFIAQIELPGRATFFCTQRYDELDATSHEVGPHPFLEGGQSPHDELLTARRAFPDATGCRTHSCTYSHMIAVALSKLGFRYASTQGVGAGEPRPFQEAWGVWQLPIFYMDNADFSASRWWTEPRAEPFSDGVLEHALSGEGIFVFAFHPVHMMLNTPSAEYYLERRRAFVEGEPLEALRFDGRGTADFFSRLCELDAEFVALEDALERHVQDEGTLLGPHQSRR
jgi:hypothetical protein